MSAQPPRVAAVAMEQGDHPAELPGAANPALSGMRASFLCALSYGRAVTQLPTPDALYESARDFAGTAISAHPSGKHHRVAVDAATALEHLAKACLAKRSPAFLVELRDGNWVTLVRLLGFPEAAPKSLRTVGLREALARVRTFVTSDASIDHLDTLIALRDGTVHAALSDEVEESLLVAFAQHADAMLADLGRDRAEFWAGQLAVVDALLADVGDKVAHVVEVKLAQARARLETKYAALPSEVLEVIRRLAGPKHATDEQIPSPCPACGSLGTAHGSRQLNWGFDDPGEGTRFYNGYLTEWFSADRFNCQVCELHLDSPSELTAANLAPRMNEETVTLEIDKDEEAAAEAVAERAWQQEQETQTY